MSTQEKKSSAAPRNIAIDLASHLPVNKFLKHFADRDYEAALKVSGSLTQKDLSKPNIQFRLGVIQLSKRQTKKAKEYFEKTIEMDPDHASANQNLGAICLENMDYAKGEEYFRKSIKLAPEDANAYNNLGACCSFQGKPKQAKEYYLKAIDLDPNRAQTMRNMTNHHKFEDYDEILVSILIGLTNPKLSDDDRSHLCFAAFKAFDDLGERARAFDFLEQGNDLYRKILDYKPKVDKDNVTIIKRAFNAPSLQKIDDFAAKHPLPFTPVFIIGMPRSGTSLTEQVLGAHSQVHGGGELPTLNHIAHPMLGRVFGKVSDAQLEMKHMKNFRLQYIQACKEFTHGQAYMTDKMPANFRWVGFIKHALPEAKIINQIRDPRAICWSIYKLRFATRGNGFAYNQKDLAAYYHRYMALMEFWEKRYPNYIHNLNYEAFTENQLDGTKALLNHVGLDWEDGCLEFHKTKRPVKTASAGQITKELYTGSSQAWRKYEEFLEPLLSALGPIE